ncbi:MAG: amino acid adenylation domain-containing protein [Verrucomicrobia bacterium]|nr:amino acid adenylation domain-containing protein [Verrucomicrobiota bacterium]
MAHTVEPSAPLSFAQERLWLIEKAMPGTPLYNLPFVLKLNGPLEPEVLRASLEALVARHPALRTTLEVQGDEPMQLVAPPMTLALPLVDYSDEADAIAQAHLEGTLAEDANAPFNLAVGPLFRARLFRMEPERHVLACTLHHAVFDGWSRGIWLRELAAAYAACAEGRPVVLPDLPLQYTDYARRQRARHSEGVLDGQLDYWRTILQAPLPLLELPLDRSRPLQRTHHGGIRNGHLPPALADALLDLGRKEGATPFIVLLTLYVALLSRYGNAHDLVVGCPVATRMDPELVDLVGFLVNTVAIRTRIEGAPSFLDLLGQVQGICLDAFSHMEVPFQHVVEAVAPPRDACLTPVFQTLFTFEDSLNEPDRLGDLSVTTAWVERDAAVTDLLLTVERNAAGLDVALTYSRDLFEDATAARMVGHLITLAASVVDAPRAPLSGLSLLPPDEAAKIRAWGQCERAYPRDATIDALFEEQAGRTPAAVAAVCAGTDEAICYGELNRQANRLAHALVRSGVRSGDSVGIGLARSPERLTAILAVLKAGAAYVPLDAGYPAERLALMAEDTGMRLILGEETMASATGRPVLTWAEAMAGATLSAETRPESGHDAEALAYIMYTSGSTGTPKGVAVTHRNVVRLVKQTNYAVLDATTRMLHMAPLTFDASTLELWGPLLNGGRVVLLPPATPSLEAIGAAVRMHGVNTLWLSSELFRAMVDERLADLHGVTQLLAGGDVLSAEHVRRVVDGVDGCTVINGYGPTENTTFTCCCPLTDAAAIGAALPIGRPIANTSVYILDARLQPVPAGVAGELWTGGDGVARGYVNRPELTGALFRDDPFSDRAGARMYRTGDRACWQPDGQVAFLGRMDRQVKIRGFRVEPGEVEAALAACPTVAQAAVLVQAVGGGERALVAYYVPAAGAAVTATVLRRALREHLPDYMMPRTFVEMGALPVTPNGKLDRDALAAIGVAGGGSVAESAPPQTVAQKLVAAVWGELLDRDTFDLRDNFFDCGGHSLLALRAVARIQKRCGAVVAPHDMLMGTLEQVAMACDPAGEKADSVHRGGIVARLKRRLGRRDKERE